MERMLLELAASGATLEQFRDSALVAAQGELGAEVGFFATGAGGRLECAELGLGGAAAHWGARWARYGAEVRAVRAEAQRAGVATDVRVLGGALRHTAVYREVIAPRGGSESLFIVPSLHARKFGLLMLGRTAGRRFSEAELGRARELGSCLSVISAALVTGAAARRTSGGCAALTRRECDLMSYLELGYTSREIACACGTSFFTVRNQLSALYRKLDVSNRTEAVGLGAGAASRADNGSDDP